MQIYSCKNYNLFRLGAFFQVQCKRETKKTKKSKETTSELKQTHSICRFLLSFWPWNWPQFSLVSYRNRFLQPYVLLERLRSYRNFSSVPPKHRQLTANWSKWPLKQITKTEKSFLIFHLCDRLEIDDKSSFFRRRRISIEMLSQHFFCRIF